MWSQTPSVTGAATPTVTFSDIYTSLQPLSTVYQPRRRLHHILWSGKCRQWAELYSNNSRLSTINLNIMPSMYFPLLKSFVVSFSAALWRNQSRQHPFRKLLSEDTKDQPGRKFSLMPHHRDFYWVRTGPTRLLMSNNSRGWWSVTKDFFVFPKGLAAVPFTSSSSVEIHVQQQTSRQTAWASISFPDKLDKVIHVCLHVFASSQQGHKQDQPPPSLMMGRSMRETISEISVRTKLKTTKIKKRHF